MSLLIPGTNSIKDTGFNISNSLRFDDGSSDYLNKSFSSSGNRQKQTISVWIKRGTLGSSSSIFSVYYTGSIYANFYFNGSDQLQYFNNGGSYNLTTTRLFRDTSAWYHILLKLDTTDSTADDRIKMYVNGVQETSFAARTNPGLNAEVTFGDNYAHYIGTYNNGASDDFDGYMSQFVFTTNVAYGPDSFGETDSDSGIWIPKEISGLTFNTNAFFLDFEDSSTLGNDVSGNNNDFGVNNLTSIDQSTDTPTNNTCNWNPLANYAQSVAFSEANLVAMSGTNDQWDAGRANMGFSKGKWYFECLFVTGTTGYQYIGVQDESAVFSGSAPHDQNGTTVFYNQSGGEIRKDGTATTADYGTFTSSQVCGVAIDADNFTISIYKGGSAIVNAYALSTTRTGFLFPMTALLNNGDGVKVNFGSPPYSESGGNSDANGYGNFNQSVPSGYFAINTKNLAEYG